MGINARRSLVGGALVLLALSACSVSLGAGSKYDAGAVEEFLATSQEGNTGDLAIGEATCPEDVDVVEGVEVECTLEIGGQAAPYTITLTDVDEDEISVNAIQAKAIIPVASAEQFVTDNLDESAAGATVDCSESEDPLILADPGDKIPCVLTLGSDTQTLELNVTDVEGNITIGE